VDPPDHQALQRNSELIMRRASEYAAGRGFRFVTCGHTHLPLVAEYDGVLYINSEPGSSTSLPVRGRSRRNR